MKSKSDELLKMAKEADLLTMGIAVSGKGDIHDGHRVTLMNFLRTLREFPRLQGLLILEDREHNNVICNDGVSQMRCGVDAEAMSAIQQNVRQAISEIVQHLSPSGQDGLYQRFNVERMSDFYAEREDGSSRGAEDLVEVIGRGHNDHLFTTYFGDVHSITDDDRILGQIIRPLSPDNKSTPRKMNKYRIDLILGMIDVDRTVYFDGLQRGAQQVDMNRDTNWSLHYLVTGALRDIVLATRKNGRSVLHIFGGDYASQSGSTGTRKVDRIKALVHSLVSSRRGARASYYTGPLLMKNGQKVSKSLGNGDGERLSLERIHQIAEAGPGTIVELED